MLRPTIAETIDNMIALAFVMLQRGPGVRSDQGAQVSHSVISRRQLGWYVWLKTSVSWSVGAATHDMSGLTQRFRLVLDFQT